jgi:ATP-binding cassette subfamily B (MDR/TAP) protein 6
MTDQVDTIEYIIQSFYIGCSIILVGRLIYLLRKTPREGQESFSDSSARHLPEAESLLEHGFDGDELRESFSRSYEYSIHPFRVSLRVLYPAQMGLALALAIDHLLILVYSVAIMKPSAQLFVLSLSHVCIMCGWLSFFIMLKRNKRDVMSSNNTQEVLSSVQGLVDIRLWSTVAFLLYASQCIFILFTHYHISFFVLYLVNLSVCFGIIILEILKYRDFTSYSSLYESIPANEMRKREKNWILLLGIAFKYVWPNTVVLRVRALVCLLLVALMRLLNLAVPFAYKRVIDEFSSVKKTPIPFSELFYPWVAVYLLLSLLQGGTGGVSVGFLPNLRSYLWIPISQNAYKRISLDIFSHILALDHNFHLHRKTGELMRIMDRGTASVQQVLSTIIFNIGPACFDIAAASIFLGIKMQFWIAVIVFVSLGIYIPMTIYVTEWRSRYRRQLNQLDNARSGRATDALLNYETVKIFGNEPLEESNYEHAIESYQAVDFKLTASMNALNIMQSFVIFSGVISGLTICTYGVAQGTFTVGDTVLFVTMMSQLYAPLNFFGTYYRMLQTAALDMEGVFNLLETEPSITDAPEATPFIGNNYEITFDNVRFSYNGIDEILKGITFKAGSGKTTSIVGSTGSGKSSTLRLLVRFYDPTSGFIRIGDQLLSSITLKSLRKVISVVPQDTVLLNDTIWYNIKYGNPSASDEEIIAAAKGACIFDTIMTKFPNGFDTLVGERGLRLSGGEKQRVAFARAILKNPPILVLDEATSSLDSITESNIQKVLSSKRKDRTVIIVAHRLSTIVDSNKIIVMDNGEIAEEGSHEELLALDKKYALLWKKQTHSFGSSSVTIE